MEGQEKQQAAAPAPTTATTPHQKSGSISIEQSVRTFRIFEVLRTGDIAAISNVIKEHRVAEESGKGTNDLPGTSILHLAVQCAQPSVFEYILTEGAGVIDINARDRDGNTPLHLAAQLGRSTLVRDLLNQPSINDSIVNYRGDTALEVASSAEIFQQLQLARSIFIDHKTQEFTAMVSKGDYKSLEKLLEQPRVVGILDVNSSDLVTDRLTAQTGGTLLHEGARVKDAKLVQLLLMHGADPFLRDKKGKLPQDVTKDDKMRAILKRSPAAVMAQRGIQERAILGNSAGQGLGKPSGTGESHAKDTREMRGYLKKWTNYTSGYKLRWFVLEDGVLSYYKHQGNVVPYTDTCAHRLTNFFFLVDDTDSACRGAINMKIAKLNMDSQDKTRFEIQSKASVKYHLKANHVVEAKRWFWTLNNAIRWAKDEAMEEEKRQSKNAEAIQKAKLDQIEGRLPSDTAPDALPASPPKSTNGKGTTSTTVPSLNVPESPSNTTTRPSLNASSNNASSRTTLDSHGEDNGSIPSITPTDVNKTDLDVDDDEDDADFASSQVVHPNDKDALEIAAQSTRIQLDLLSNVATSLQSEKAKNPNTAISDPTIQSALAAYEEAVSGLRGLMQNLFHIYRDRDAYWHARVGREEYVRRMWEESMTKVAQEHEDLQSKIGESEEKRRRTKRALKEALGGRAGPQGQLGTPADGEATPPVHEPNELSSPTAKATAGGAVAVAAAAGATAAAGGGGKGERSNEKTGEKPPPTVAVNNKKTALDHLNEIYDSGSDEDEFFDAIDSGEIEVEDRTAEAENEAKRERKKEAKEAEDQGEEPSEVRAVKRTEVVPSFKGYEDPVRKRLAMDKDNRPKISLWVSSIKRKHIYVSIY